MTRRKRLTDAGIERLRPSRKEYTVWDTQLPGLGVRVRPSGYRSYVWQGHVSGAAVRVTIGSAALGTIDEARRKSLELRNGSGPSGPEDGNGFSSIPLFGDFALSEWKPVFGQRWGPSRRQICRAYTGQANSARLRRLAAGHDQAGRCRALVRRRQPHRARRGQHGAFVAATDPAGRGRDRPHRQKPDARHQEESSPEAEPIPVDRGDRPAARRSRPSRRRTALPTGTGRHHPPAAPDRLPPGGDPEPEMGRGRRRRSEADGNQDRPTTGMAERSCARHHRPSAAHGGRLRLSLAQRIRQDHVPRPSLCGSGRERRPGSTTSGCTT